MGGKALAYGGKVAVRIPAYKKVYPALGPTFFTRSILKNGPQETPWGGGRCL